MNEKIKNYIKNNEELLYKTLKELCSIPAPSHFEEKRAKYCKNWLEKNGAKGVYIDKALNVVFPINCEESSKITTFVAHTDTVFPDTEPFAFFDDGEKIHCPGVADDAASVVCLLLTAKFFIENNIKAENGIMFVLNSCEEGLGNLKGTRQIFSDYKDRIETFISVDCALEKISHNSVGSTRYEVTVTTEGGHSFHKFGSPNAIAVLSEIITELYKIKVPQKENTKTTYNVGIIEGGTSVNTIAQSARMLCEYRSDDKECLDIMEKEFKAVFEKFSREATLSVKVIGERPCSITPRQKIEALKQKIVPIVEGAIGKEVTFISSSTDCNIPLSLGVSALCIGSCRYSGMHTREEWLEKDSIKTGLEIVLKSALKLTE